jgi:putative ABC transport system substrate-binding protein
MNRRDTVLALIALGAAPLISSSQQPTTKVARIGFLGSNTSSDSGWRVAALRAGLRDFGYVEGKNFVIEFRWADNNYERLPALATELVELKVDVIVTGGTPGSLAAKRATTTIPIVIAAVADPVAGGLVANLARPGGNITGQTYFNAELNAKRLELLKEAFPLIRRVAVLLNSDNPASPVREMEAAARSLKMEIQKFEVRSPSEFESAFVAMDKRRVQAVAVIDEPMLITNAATVASIAAKHRIPSIGFVDFANGGGLMAYGVGFRGMYRRAAYFVDKILKGTSPGDLPIEGATKFDLVINLKTAKALGIKIPQSMLLRADRVIE